MTVSEFAGELKKQDQILILTHRNPDGDTLGSAGALCLALRSFGKRAALFPNEQITEQYLPFVGDLQAAPDFAPEFIVAVDLASENMFPRGWNGNVDLTVDHHPSNTRYARLGTLLKPEKAACGEIILEVLKEMNAELTPRIADELYMAVSTDCGCFQFANTNAATLRAAAELAELGADLERINKRLFRTVSRSRMRLEGLLVSDMRFYRGGEICVVRIPLQVLRETGAEEKDLDDITAIAGKTEGVRVGITIREQEGGFAKASLRTDGGVNASTVCAGFGGGGHARAAGCTVKTDLASLERELVAATEAQWG